MRSRRTDAARNGGPIILIDPPTPCTSPRDDELKKRRVQKQRRRCILLRLLIVALLTCCLFVGITANLLNENRVADDGEDAAAGGEVWSANNLPAAVESRAPMGSIIYGAKSKGDDTARLVKEAIQSGFRHIATGGFHNEYNEPGVGAGWKESGIPRNELYLQTLFLANSVNGYGTQNCLLKDGACPPSKELSIEDQVHLSIRSSLHNLQTEYLDAMLVHNYRAKLQPYEETMRAWRVLESYVDKGVVRDLGIVSVHDAQYLTKLHNEARIKPAIIQNRFHSNRGYDIELRPLFKEYGLSNQLFWILTGSAGGKVRNDAAVKRIAERMGVSPQVLLYSFTMALGGSPLIGTKSLAHMKEDVEALVTKKLEWKRDDLTAMAGVLNRKLLPLTSLPL